MMNCPSNKSAKLPPRTAREILEVGEIATAAEITIAYRRRAMRLHPDRNPNNLKAKEEFQQLQNAYRELLEAAKDIHFSELDWDAFVSGESSLAAADKTIASEEEDGDWREDIPYLSIIFIFCGLVGAIVLSFVVGLGFVFCLAAFSLSLLLALQFYRPPDFLLGLRIERGFRLSVRIYFVTLLAAGVFWLFNQLLAKF